MEEDIKILEALKETLMKDKFIIPKEPEKWCKALEHLIKAYKEKEYKYNKALSDLVQAEHENKELKEENEKLIADNLEYLKTQDIFDERTYRKKYLEERRKEEPNLLYPDSDEIYKRYYKLRHENKELKEKIRSCEDEIQEQAKDLMFYEETIRDEYIQVSLVKEEIEELSDDLEIMKVDAMYGRFKEYGGKLSFDKRFSYKYGMHDILQKLLERS